MGTPKQQEVLKAYLAVDKRMRHLLRVNLGEVPDRSTVLTSSHKALLVLIARMEQMEVLLDEAIHTAMYDDDTATANNLAKYALEQVEGKFVESDGPGYDPRRGR
jgi:hypothetical protein